MNQAILEGKYRQMRGAMQEEWGKLTDDDIRMFVGKTDRLVGKLMERYGYTREQAEDQVDQFLDRFSTNRMDAAMASIRRTMPESFSDVQNKMMRTTRRHPWWTVSVVVGLFGLFSLLTAYRALEKEKESKGIWARLAM